MAHALSGRTHMPVRGRPTSHQELEIFRCPNWHHRAVIQPLRHYNMGQDNLSLLEDCNRSHDIVCCGVLGLDPNQVTQLEEAEPDAIGNVVFTWRALVDQPPPALGKEVGPRTKAPTSPEQCSGKIVVSPKEAVDLRAVAGTRRTQADVDSYLARQREDPEEWWEV